MSLEGIVNRKLIDVDNVTFIEGDPLSVFPKGYELQKIKPAHGYYRRGEGKDFGFIPLWLYSLLPITQKTIFFLKPLPTKEEFYEYCGVLPKDLATLVNDKQIVPILDNDVAKYQENVFEDFFGNLEKDFELIRAQLYEDKYTYKKFNWFINEKGAFENLTKMLTNDYSNRKFTPESQKAYDEKKKDDPLMPALKDLPKFVAERVVWQVLKNEEDNVNELRNLMEKNDPIEIYEKARLIHYTVNGEFYGRDGIIWLSHGEDEEIKKIKNNAIKSGLNVVSRSEPSICFNYPIGLGTSTPIISKIREIFKKYDYTKDGLIKEVKNSGILKNKFYDSPEKCLFKNETKLQEISTSWNDIIKSFVTREAYVRTFSLRALQGAYYIPAIYSLIEFLREGDPITPEDSEDIKGLIFSYVLEEIPRTGADINSFIEGSLNQLKAIVPYSQKIDRPMGIISPVTV